MKRREKKAIDDSVDSPIEEVLKRLGLSENELKVAFVLLELKTARVSKISKVADIPRQTTYSILLRLSHEGLITPIAGKGVRRFSLEYAQLKRYVDERRTKLVRVRESLETGRMPESARETGASSLPNVVYYEGSVGLEHLFDSMLEVYKKRKSKKFRGYGINFIAGTKGLEESIRRFLKERGELDVSTDLFIAKGPDDFKITDESTRLGRNIKHLDIDEQNAGIYFVASRVYLFSFKDNVGVMIENQAIAEFLKSAFDDHFAKST